MQVEEGDEIKIEVDPAAGITYFYHNGVEVLSEDGHCYCAFLPVLTVCTPGVVVEMLPVSASKMSSCAMPEEVAVDVLEGLEGLCNEAEHRATEYRESCNSLHDVYHGLSRVSIEEVTFLSPPPNPTPASPSLTCRCAGR